MVILLAAVLGLSTILLGQLKIIREMENSVVALYAAETGIEHALEARIDLVAFKSADPCSESSPCPVGSEGAEYYIEIDFSSDPSSTCPAAFVCVKSVGVYRNAVRALQASY